MEAEVRDVLVGMKEHLSRGWVQNELVASDGVCLFGAMALAADLKPHWMTGAGAIRGRTGGGMGFTYNLMKPEGQAMAAIADEIGISQVELALWNDAPGRTVDDIIAVIDRILLSDSPTSEIPESELELVEA